MMSRILNLFSPRSAAGSMFWSIGVHVAVAGGVIGYMNWSPAPEPPAEEYIDLAYEVIDEPPLPAPPPPPPEQNAPRELQDEKSDVVGTQEKKEEKPEDGQASQQRNLANTPYYKIKPKYPRAALISGVEGWVLLEIDVTEKGDVENVRVLDGEQKNMFASEARRAVSLYKYRPFVDKNGNPVRMEGHQVRVEFKLEEASDSASM